MFFIAFVHEFLHDPLCGSRCIVAGQVDVIVALRSKDCRSFHCDNHFRLSAFSMSRRVGHGFDDVQLGGFPIAGGHRGLGAATPPRTAPGGFGRHGSGARGATSTGFGGPLGITPTASLSPRRQREEDGDGGSGRGHDRERDRDGSRPRRNSSAAAHPQDDMESVLLRLNHIDGMLRKHGQAIAAHGHDISVLHEQTSILDNLHTLT